MLARVCQFLVIGLIVTNPFFCRVRGCGVTARFVSAEACVAECEAACERSREACGCCDQQKQTPERSRNKPCDCPGNMFCQCFSAGAVVEDPLPFPATCSVFPLVAAVHVPALVAWDDGAVWTPGHGPPVSGAANPGRMLRCLHCSLLC